MVSPALVTLIGKEDQRLGWIEALILNAVTNIFSDITGVWNGTESWKTAITNTFVPNIGKLVAQKVFKWDDGLNQPAAAAPDTSANDIINAINQAAATAAQPAPATQATTKKNYNTAMVAGIAPLALSTALQILKGSRL
jgi:hypothetical protein